MKTCLYGRNELDLRTLVRNNHSAEDIAHAIQQAVFGKAQDGLQAEAQRSPVEESMATIGG
jgi:molybdenum cofactor biosynthesis enzyme MoaA